MSEGAVGGLGQEEEGEDGELCVIMSLAVAFSHLYGYVRVEGLR